MAMSNRDMAQCIRHSYDDLQEAIKTVPAAATSFEIELDADDGDSVLSQPRSVDTTNALTIPDASSDTNSAAVDISNYRGFSVVVVYATLTGTLDGVVKLQASLDDTTYVDLTGETVTLNAAGGSHLFNVSDANYKYFRVVHTANGLASGTVDADYMLKG